MISSREHLAWAAGLFDGEGSFILSVTKSARNRQGASCIPLASISQVDRRVLDRFREAVGIGGVCDKPWKKQNPNARPQYKFTALGFERVQAIAALLWPWLGDVKQQQAARVLADGLAYARNRVHHINRRRVLTASEVMLVRERIASGELHRVIAGSLGCSRSAVSLIAQGRTHREAIRNVLD